METGGITRFQTVPLVSFSICLIVAFAIRFYGIWWDKGTHLHPDERMIIMVAERFSLPNSDTVASLFTPQSPLNPKFFAYGSFPIYLLAGVSWLVGLHTYDGMLLVGRLLSIIFEIGTISILFLFARRVKTIPFIVGLCYAASVLPIQSSHFFITDIPLTFFCAAFIFSLGYWYEKKTVKIALVVGTIFGFSLATKITSIVLAAPLIITSVFMFIQKYRKESIIQLFAIGICTVAIFSLLQPYTWIDFPLFRQQIAEQTAMRNNPYVFPYTLQYVFSQPYIYFIEQYTKWGVGIPMATGVCIGFLLVMWDIVNSFITNKRKWFFEYTKVQWFIVVIFVVVFFVSIGGASVKFMRYMLPLYPMAALFFGQLLTYVVNYIRHHRSIWWGFILGIYSISCVIWTMAFVTIFSREHTRISADTWIHENIPSSARLAVEHWDDRLPLFQSEKYIIRELPLYDIPDDELKWQKIQSLLAEVDYVIIASNRLYTPLIKLTDCMKVKYGRCYPRTAAYYQDLFSGKMGFTLVKTFISNPTVSLGPWKWEIDDQQADESFTVYDHPKIMIFQKKTL